MHIRDAAPEERAFIREQRLDAYREHARSIPDSHWQALARAISSEADAQPGAELIVAEADGNIAGSVVLFPANTDAYDGHADKQDYPEIRMLAVSPAYRGKGAASALIAECIRRARASGSGAVGLHTGEFMKDARQLYEKLGFERLPQYDFQPADDGITVMAFRLNL
ncbi:GNAT family N-acetyltransferase [Cohnella hashimotonis]|uniref:GNAT family N-acetyltransferase n=1 Tax=Cohnella hashimotonis TaxID=2826895 RepID=A0ABT6TQB9_9BACL|nr:GNAT family N-acetyltransferase [Cohnella hashimotonis]MDI4649038.1 GNAT family N-acetyltransferase [Cohnella hashimotonis]